MLDVRRALVIATMMVLCAPVSLARPQKGHASWFKIVGRVQDGKGRPIHWGRVYLKDTYSHFLIIKQVSSDGQFSSALLDARLDYEIYAEQDDLSSERVLISGPNKAPEIIITLRLHKKEETH